ncbi:hypothetical protein LUU34_00226500 [Aix galericulata]|nr:hypothetical protein LUU34_00226500 [Aix galericulata]
MAAFPRRCAPHAGSARLCRAAAPHPSPERAGERSVLPFSGGDAAGGLPGAVTAPSHTARAPGTASWRQGRREGKQWGAGSHHPRDAANPAVPPEPVVPPGLGGGVQPLAEEMGAAAPHAHRPLLLLQLLGPRPALCHRWGCAGPQRRRRGPVPAGGALREPPQPGEQPRRSTKCLKTGTGCACARAGAAQLRAAAVPRRRAPQRPRFLTMHPKSLWAPAPPGAAAAPRQKSPGTNPAVPVPGEGRGRRHGEPWRQGRRRRAAPFGPVSVPCV